MEAVISFFNPEMIPEWKVLHGAEYRLGFDHEKAAARWSLVVPADDGTFAALITALRLTGGDHEAPLADGTLAVERLGGPGAAVGVRREPAKGVALASSRAVLERAGLDPPELLALADTLESGLVFQVDPGRLAPPGNANLFLRRAVVLSRGLGCRRALGSMGLREDRLAVEISTELELGQSVSSPGQDAPAIDPAWLKWIPADEAAAFASIALGRGPAFWEGAFATADRVDREDPARANMAPLRTRVNLLAAAAGARLEADLWPHLRGMTFALLADPRGPSRPERALIALHIDEETAARRIADEILPRLAGLGGGLKKPVKTGQDGRARPGALPDPSSPRQLGRVGGRPVASALRGRTVLIGWGEGTLASALGAGERVEGSFASSFGVSWLGPGGKPPARVGAFWPGRIPIPVKGLDGPTPLVQALAQGPPVVWTGWNQAGRATDRVSWPGLTATVQRFLEEVPLAENPAP